MIATKLMGGLGNQMFQYAIAFAVSDQVYIDFSFLREHKKSNETFTGRHFGLNIFPNLSFKEFTQIQRFAYLSKPGIPFEHRIRKILNLNCAHVKQFENEFVSFQVEKNMYFDGYFQSEKYFSHHRQKILTAFQFPEMDLNNKKLKEQILADKNAVSIHMRRGDYLKPAVRNYHGILSVEYYKAAIRQIQSQHNNVTLYIFSDDMQFAREAFESENNCVFVEGNEEQAWADMALMSLCRHHVVANSSFSWWGAWLSKSNGLNVAPRNWFNPSVVKFEITDIVPDHWMLI